MERVPILKILNGVFFVLLPILLFWVVAELAALRAAIEKLHDRKDESSS